jgi:nucleoside-diphosphate kinase
VLEITMIEDTLVILKPDALSRGLVGIVTERLEQVGLKLVACKMVMPDKASMDKIYDTSDKKWVEGMGQKTLKTFYEYSIDVKEHMGTNDPYKLGLHVAKQLKDYMLSGPIIVMVWEGMKAVSTVRKVRGVTVPIFADIGSILGDYSHDSPLSTTMQDRSLRNLVHASGTEEEAKKEIKIWFGNDFKPMEYDRTDAQFF